MPILRVCNLTVSFNTSNGHLTAIDNISFSVDSGEILGLVGESGTGKSLTAAAINGLLEPPGTVSSGKIFFEDERIDTLPEAEMKGLRGKQIGTIFQDASTSLNPLFSVGHQIVETIQTHIRIGTIDAKEMAINLLTKVGLSSAEERFNHYPHQFSGGMRHRIVIALALCVSPKFLIADEPTSSLDAVIQVQIIQLLKNMSKDYGTAILLITHDMGVISEICDRIVVMYLGNIFEIGTAREILEHPSHPYTRGLINSIPVINSNTPLLQSIEGTMPALRDTPSGCPFHPRCPDAMAKCSNHKPGITTVNGSQVSCLLYEESE